MHLICSVDGSYAPVQDIPRRGLNHIDQLESVFLFFLSVSFLVAATTFIILHSIGLHLGEGEWGVLAHVLVFEIVFVLFPTRQVVIFEVGDSAAEKFIGCGLNS